MDELIQLFQSILGKPGSGRADVIRAGRELGWVPSNMSRNVKALPSAQKDQLIRSFIDRLRSNPAAVPRFQQSLNFTPSGTGGGGLGSTIGGILGGVIGTAIGGPGGTAIGTKLGGSIGGGITQAAGGRQGTPSLGFDLPTGPAFGNGLTAPTSQPQPTTQNGMASDISQLLGSNQIVMEPQKKTINSAPPGWVIVTMPDGSKKAVLKDVAKCLGLWKRRKKPPISASDWSKLKRANAVKKKAKRIAETADFVCRKSKR